MDEDHAFALRPGLEVFTSDDEPLGRIKNVWTPSGDTLGPAADKVWEPNPVSTPATGIGGLGSASGAVARGGTVTGSGGAVENEAYVQSVPALGGVSGTGYQNTGAGEAQPIEEAPVDTLFQIDRDFAPDWYVPAKAVADVQGDTVTLRYTKDEADDQNWGVKPDFLADM